MTLVTVGDGKITHGDYSVAAGSTLDVLLNTIQSHVSGITLLPGDYVMAAPFQCNKDRFKIYGSGLVQISIEHGQSVGFIDIASGKQGCVVDGIEFRYTVPKSGQSTLKAFNGLEHKFTNNVFFVYTGIAHTVISLASPMKCIDVSGCVGVEVSGNAIRPYYDVYGIYMENNSASTISNNKIYNGLNIEFMDLAAFLSAGVTAFPIFRPCKQPIFLKNERHGWVRHNYIWCLGFTADTSAFPQFGGAPAQIYDASIYYENDAPSSGPGAKEHGHMDISDNKIELCAAHRGIWAKGLRFSRINNNLIGVPQNNGSQDASYLLGHGSIVVDQGTHATIPAKSDHVTILGNQAHNPGRASTGPNPIDAAGIYVANVDDVFIGNNHISLVFTNRGIYVGNGSTNVGIRGNNIHFGAASAAKIGITIVGETTDEIVVGENTIHNSTAAAPIVSTASGTKIIIGGLFKTNAASYTTPADTDTPDTLTTNARVV